MGLDSVELLVAVEETFDIEISNPEAEKIATVGDFYDAVWDKIKDKQSNKCKTAILFYKFRSFFQDRYGINRHNFKPDSKLENIIPKDQRKAEWKYIQQELGLKLPKLILPSKLRNLLFNFGAISIIGVLILAFLEGKVWNGSYIWWCIPLVVLGLTILLYQAAQPFRTRIKQKSVKEFVESIIVLNYNNFSNFHGSNRAEMERIMSVIIQDRSGVDFSEIKPEAQIVNDLGIN